MLRYLMILLPLSFLGWTQDPSGSSQNALARAEALYFEARFIDAIDILRPVEDALRSQPGRTDEKIGVQLYLALAYVGLNNDAAAKSHFAEICALDPDYTLDPLIFSSKVITLFEETKLELRCNTLCRELSTQIALGNATPLLERMAAGMDAGGGPVCACLAALPASAAATIHALGVEAYQEERLGEALDRFQTVLQLQPGHPLAMQFLELTRGKLRLDLDRTFLEWRMYFDNAEFPAAAAAYHQLIALNREIPAGPLLDQIHQEYRAALTRQLEAWNQACSSGDLTRLDPLRRQAAEMLPDRAIGADLLERMVCRHQGCVRLDGSLAMPRLTQRVAPILTSVLRQQVAAAPATVYVQVNIDGDGDVRVIETQGVHAGIRDAVRTAVGQWKFDPVVFDGTAYCVDTILSVTVGPD